MARSKKTLSNSSEIKKALDLLLYDKINYTIDRKYVAGEGSFFEPNDVVIGSKRPKGMSFDAYIRNVLSTIFHEYAHVYQNRKKIWQAYLKKDITHSSRISTIRGFLRTALRCERHADKLGAKFMKEMFPNRKFIGSYNDPEIVADWKKDFTGEAYSILRSKIDKKKK